MISIQVKKSLFVLLSLILSIHFGGCAKLQDLLRPPLPKENKEWIKEVKSISKYFKKKPSVAEYHKEMFKREGKAVSWSDTKIKKRLEEAAYTLSTLKHWDHPEMKPYTKMHFKNHLKYGKLVGATIAEETKFKAKQNDPLVCTPADLRTPAKKEGCPYPDETNLCHFNVMQGLSYAIFHHLWNEYPKLKKQIMKSHFDGYKKQAKSVNKAKNKCYKRLIKKTKPHKNFYTGSDKKKLIKTAKQAWKARFGKDPMLKIVIFNKQWTRKKYDEWKDGVKYYYDSSKLDGYTYRRLENGVVRGELVRWWKDHIKGTEGVNVCTREYSKLYDCFYYDLLEKNLK